MNDEKVIIPLKFDLQWRAPGGGHLEANVSGENWVGRKYRVVLRDGQWRAFFDESLIFWGSLAACLRACEDNER